MISPRKSCSLKLFRQIRQRHDGKFQALALVNAHQPDGVFFRQRRDFRLGLGFALRLDEFQKAKQALPLKLVELLREIQETLDVRAPLRAARTRLQPVGVMRFRQDVFQALRERNLLRQFPPARKSFQKFSGFSACFARQRLDFEVNAWFSAIQKCPGPASRISASSSSEQPTSGERNTAMHGTSCNGLSSSCNRLNKSEISLLS